MEKIINGEIRSEIEWKKWRESILTASDVVKCITPKKMEIGKQYINIARKIALAQLGINDELEESGFKSQAMERGNRLEQEYSKKLNESWEKEICLSTTREGDDEMPIGASFDFINRTDFEIIELKCPLSYNFLDEVENISNEYIIQCKFQLYVLSFLYGNSFSGNVVVYHDKVGEVKKEVLLSVADCQLFDELISKINEEIKLNKNKIVSFM